MKHIVDQTRGNRTARLVRYAALDRQRGQKVRAPMEALRRMPRGLSTSLRLRRYLALDRAGV